MNSVIVFTVQNGLKQRDALFPLLLISALEYSIKKMQGKSDETEIKTDIHQSLSLLTICVYFVIT
jgi:hypothetical protein